mmetsp:Transcript_111743/g.315613  ORF Transcript_111743/g.315613 Transcript_111743/m.315613 type:complete len:255 (-) Transcript_111743:577-1341(-)
MTLGSLPSAKSTFGSPRSWISSSLSTRSRSRTRFHESTVETNVSLRAALATAARLAFSARMSWSWLSSASSAKFWPTSMSTSPLCATRSARSKSSKFGPGRATPATGDFCATSHTTESGTAKSWFGCSARGGGKPPNWSGAQRAASASTLGSRALACSAASSAFSHERPRGWLGGLALLLGLKACPSTLGASSAGGWAWTSGAAGASSASRCLPRKRLRLAGGGSHTASACSASAAGFGCCGAAPLEAADGLAS